MGSCVAPAFANTYMFEVEHHAFFSDSNTASKIPFFTRYIDDLFLIWTGTEQDFNILMTAINTMESTIKFTYQMSSQSVNYLDVQISVTNGKICTSLYKKATDRNTILHANSQHPNSTKRGLPFSQFLRIHRISDDIVNAEREINDMMKQFMLRGYKYGDLVKAKERALAIPRSRTLIPSGDRQKRLGDCIPFVQQYCPASPHIVKTVKNLWPVVTTDPELSMLKNTKVLASYTRNRNLKDWLVKNDVSNTKKVGPITFLTRKAGCYRCTGCTTCSFMEYENSRFHASKPRRLTPAWNLPIDSLNVSTVLLCPLLLACKPCLRIEILVNATGLPKLHGFDVQGLETSTNTFHSFSISKKKSPKINLWQVQYDCWTVAHGQYIYVTLSTKPNYGVPVSKKYYIANMDAKPRFQFQHLAEEKRFEVSIPQGPDVYTRLCYQYNICDDLPDSPKKLLNASMNASLPYQHLLPCLCIEVFNTCRDSRRKKICPFQDHPEPYAAEMLNVSVQEIWHYTNTMMVTFINPCGTVPEVSFCMKENENCITVPDAIVERVDTEYYLASVDRDPHLCFKFTLLNNTLIKCPGGRDWNINMKKQLFDVRLTVSSNVTASFSAVICHQDQSTGHCHPQSVIYNVSMVGKEVHWSLPIPDIGSCIEVWRSDVRYAHKYLICSFDFSHKHLGLVVLATVVVVFMLILLLFLSYQRIWKIFTAPLWRRTILLVYSPDSAEYRNLICVFADLLQSILGCEVILDLWDMNTISQIGMLPWFYQKRELVTQRKGKVMIVWSKRSKTMYEQWRSRKLNSMGWKDSNNLFGAAMSCLQKDFEVVKENEHLQEYTMVYFEGLCNKKDIPKSLRKISRYRLFKDLYRLVSKLQDTTCLSPPCLIKAVAKYLIKKLISSEKSQGLKKNIELCKQKLLEEVT
ncbi:interleukin-17 receptor E [Pseudophryne corroboree]|uniref:interleukin-17 receptor E n=1 Tax=Pseudophryne corroboree TaxID=495146 RepID=UPI0030815751